LAVLGERNSKTETRVSSDLARRFRREKYGDFEPEARKRLGVRDPDDWPVLAAALALDCPIWTEDTDFFGCGVATWTTNRVEMRSAKCPSASR
jgi:predicted nucleic acid-binding protein